MSEFEDNLWREVQRTYGSELSDAPDPLRRRSRPGVPVLAGTSLGVVGAGVAAVIVLTAASSSPAFAVNRHADGTVSVVIRRIEGIAGANRRLEFLGIRARAVAVSGVCPAAPPPGLTRVTMATVRGRSVNWVGVAPGRMAERIRPTQIPVGRTLVIPAVPGGAVVRLVHGRAVSGPVPACLPPVVFVRPGSGAARGRIVICRAGITPYPRTIVIGGGTDTNGTNTGTGTNGSPPSTATVTSTNTNATSTNPGTATQTTDQGTATNGTTTSGSPPAGGTNAPLPPPLLRHCQLNAERLALGAAAARAKADRGGRPVH
ncbi:MAG: hypothetical protein ACRDNK_01580 [Solirubrobacteraceae bacterium]